MEPWDGGSDLRLTLVGLLARLGVDEEFTELLIGVELIKDVFKAGEGAAKLSCQCLNCSNLFHKSSSTFAVVSFWSIVLVTLDILVGFCATEVTEMPVGRFGIWVLPMEMSGFNDWIDILVDNFDSSSLLLEVSVAIINKLLNFN